MSTLEVGNVRNTKRQEEVVVEAREEVVSVGGGAGGRVLRNRKRQEEVVEEVVIEAHEEVGGGGGGGGRRVLRKRKRPEEDVIEAREEVGEVGVGEVRGGGVGGRVLRKRNREDEAQLEAWEEAPAVCRGQGRGQRQREVVVDKEDEVEEDDLQSEAAEDDDLQSKVEGEDDELQAESEEDEEKSDLGDDELDDEPPVGPQDQSLLKDFRNHVAAAIWGGTERKLLKIYNHSCLLRKWELPKTNRRFMEKVKASGLLPLAGITYKYSNYVLVSAFVERWHPEMNSFHFWFGEMTITLDDVSYLIGGPSRGVGYACFHGKEDCVALLRRWLGVTKRNAKAAVCCGGVTFD
ncbi:hypothetical protein RHMOL_Rhmol01G0181300 [Rhododendron molle]|uniref:Uncharacterized protein n=1 Tax=Rhododendron molle TaxID=49168 RepID=A0ACC0Q3A0_RHOML|nr:hypothetical protein RHMOL_Rhmol01G0181300 [Rhododendron molle]